MSEQLGANIDALRAEDAPLIFPMVLLIRTDRADAAFVVEDMSIAHQLLIGASTLQTELYAMKMALKHAIVTTHSTIHIFADSLSALQSPSHR